MKWQLLFIKGRRWSVYGQSIAIIHELLTFYEVLKRYFFTLKKLIF